MRSSIHLERSWLTSASRILETSNAPPDSIALNDLRSERAFRARRLPFRLDRLTGFPTSQQ